MEFQNRFTYFSPTRIISGRGAIEDIPQLLAIRPEKKALIVTDIGLIQAGLVDRITSMLDTASLNHAVYSGVIANPPISTVQACADCYQKSKCDFLIGFGGGSSMDVAQAAGILINNGGKIQDYFGPNKAKARMPFCICVPCTYGTGSEVTPFAVITDNNQYKNAVIGPEIIPDVGILDSEMAVALPLPIAGATGMDALTHAIESYTSLSSNTISEGLALQAIRLISKNLRQAGANDYNHNATQQMLIASTTAGMAFSQTRLGNVHALSHPVSGHYDVPHGIANAILLPHIMDFNRMACPTKFADIAVALGENIEGLDDMEAATCAVRAAKMLGQDVGIPPTLSEAGATMEGILTMAEDAMKSGNIPINPRKTTLSDVISLYEQSM